MCARKLGKLKEAIKMFREVSVYVTSFFDRPYRYDIGGTIHSDILSSYSLFSDFCSHTLLKASCFFTPSPVVSKQIYSFAGSLFEN